MPIKPPKYMRTMVTSIIPLESWDYDDGSNDPWLFHDYKWTLQLTIEPQIHSYHLSNTPYEYNGLDLEIGDWIATNEGGISVQIIDIITVSATAATVIVEDIDRYNIVNDNTLSGIGIGPTGKGMIFQLSDDGLPVIVPNVSGWLDKNFQTDLISRFTKRNLYKKYIKVIQANHNFSVGDIICISGNTYKKVSNTSSEDVEKIVGIVQESFSYNDNHNYDWFTYEPYGKFETDITLPGNFGDLLYIGLDGQVSLSKPTTNSRPIYINLGNNNAILLNSTSMSVSGDTDAQTYSVDINTLSQSVIPIASISDGSRVTLVSVTVVDIFDQSASLTIGDNITNSRLMDSTVNDLNEIGVYETNPSYHYRGSGDVTIYAYFNKGSSTSGSATITISYV